MEKKIKLIGNKSVTKMVYGHVKYFFSNISVIIDMKISILIG